VRLAIVVGHREHAQGATAVDGSREWAHHRVLADQIAAYATAAGHDVRVFLRPDIQGYAKPLAVLVGQVNAYMPELVIALHFDAALVDFKGVWRGTSGRYWPGSKAGKMWAVQLSAAVSQAQGTRNRGAVAQAVSSSGKTLYVLRDTRAPAVIVETHFGDHPEDHRRALSARDSGATAQAIVGVLS